MLTFWDYSQTPGSSGTLSAASSRPPNQKEALVAAPAPSDESKSAAVLSLPERPTLSEPRGKLFGSQSWQPPAPKITAVAPQTPSAPPMPYRYAGKLVRNGLLQVFLSKGDTAIPITAGEVIDGVYRIEAIGEDRITIIYLPLGLKENIPMSASPDVAAASSSNPEAVAPANTAQVGLGTIPIPIGSVISPAGGPLPASNKVGKPSQIFE